MAAGGDVILIPEIEYDIDVVANTLLERNKKGKPYSIVVVAEGIKKKKKKKSAATYIGDKIESMTGLETRVTILGYIQRGGSPSPMDRILATRYGAYAAELISNGEFGTMVSLRNNEIISVPLEEVGGKLRLVEPTDRMIKKATGLGICLGRKSLD